MAFIEESSRLPQCSRCCGNLLISAVMPQDDDQGWPIHLELCTSCDSGDATRPAAGILVQFFADGGGHDESRSQEAAQLLTEWTREAMAAHGWYWHEKPPDQL
ncbi:DUF6300 family protein [Streptomyces sp. NPDC057746]|uniref:DUF6300 family protein n=1 Tax=Streptomyces sp. NPDC057746 TaxID=3346237 RepID=UPI00369EC952